MNKYPQSSEISKIINESNKIVIIQADNPDGDSLSSSLALEQILNDMGKDTYLYCGIEMPEYLKHLSGWDRVSKEIPNQFDVSIVVDTSAMILLEKLNASRYRSWVASKPVIILDHHADVKCDIPYATVVLNNKQAVSTGEAIHQLATQLKWPLNIHAKTFIASSILADSLGLTTEETSSETYRTMADLIDGGVDRPALEEARRALMKMPEPIFRYKARLIERTELYADGHIAIVTVPYDEITTYSPLYNPAPLIQTDMLQTEKVRVAIVLKHYKDGKITGSIRCGYNAKIASDLAEHFGGGGHPYASGFKIDDGRSLKDTKAECLKVAEHLLDRVPKNHYENI